MGLIAEQASELVPRTGKVKLDDTLDAMDAEDRAAILDLLANPAVSAIGLVRFLKRHGIEVGRSSIYNYRRDELWTKRSDWQAAAKPPKTRRR